ncbi:unnamed protein product [Colias eurytheme]|nr:unnamed protein product [Colias eurytheme]
MKMMMDSSESEEELENEIPNPVEVLIKKNINEYVLDKRIENEEDPLLWWKVNSNKYGILSPVARDICVLDPDSLYYYPKHSNTTASAYVKRHRPQRTTTYNKDTIPGLYKHLRKFLCHPERFSRDEYVDSIDDPGRRKAYRAAVTDLENGDGAVARVTPFTKIEKCTTSKYKAPRMIQGRDIRFNVEYGRYIKPLEIRLTRKSAYRHNFGKGDYDEIAADMEI